MIRRETVDAAGPCWALVSQVEHARLAYAAAREWGNEPYTLASPRDEFLAAVACHDDGWGLWEARQPVGADGKPIQFLETPPDQILPVWTRSIEVCRQIGPLAGALVAGHFLNLLAQHGTAASGLGALAAEDFRERFTSARAHWLEEWADDRPDNAESSARRAEAAQKQLRFFDLLSLWLCMAERTEPHDLTPPDGPPIKFTPHGEGRFTLAPWPFLPNRVALRARARVVPAKPYESVDDLAQTPGRQIDLHFILTPERS